MVIAEDHQSQSQKLNILIVRNMTLFLTNSDMEIAKFATMKESSRDSNFFLISDFECL